MAADGDAHQLLILDIFLTLASSTGLPQMEHSARLKAQSGRCWCERLRSPAALPALTLTVLGSLLLHISLAKRALERE